MNRNGANQMRNHERPVDSLADLSKRGRKRGAVPPSPSAPPAARRRLRLSLEALEDRLTPAVPVQLYFVPLPEAAIRTSFGALYSGTSQQINSVISLATT